MSSTFTAVLKTMVDEETKERFEALARASYRSTQAQLRLAVEQMLERENGRKK